jgi:hypothetical protein
MKLNEENIQKYATPKELQEMARFSPPKNQIFLVFKSTGYVESFEETFMGSFTNGKSAYQAAISWYNKHRKK